MKDVHTAIFLRLGKREGSAKMSELKNVVISDIKATCVSKVASSIVGVPGGIIDNVLIKNVEITLPGGGTINDANASIPEVKEADIECCGQHEVCEKDSLLAAVSKKIEYYDDEELDQFIGKEANAYTDEETNQFRDVLYTMQDIDVAGWVRSLQLRGIELPDDLKDEVFLIIGERRNGER
jgi:succinate dehydrogenase flavin-adding protein (antitoxin of CptAB toxin-antitoxin module)